MEGNIIDWAKRLTEYKSPGDATAQPQSATAELEKAPAETPAQVDKNKSETPPETPIKKVTEAEADASAETYLTLLEAPLVVLGSIMLDKKLKKKFSDAEIEELIQINSKEDPTPGEKRKSDRFNYLLSQVEKKKGNLKIIGDERQRAKDQLMAYVKATGQTANPAFILAVTALNIIGNRAIDIFVDNDWEKR